MSFLDPLHPHSRHTALPEIKSDPNIPAGTVIVIGPQPDRNEFSTFEQWMRAWAKKCAVLKNVGTGTSASDADTGDRK